jgi:hypothetical protein
MKKISLSFALSMAVIAQGAAAQAQPAPAAPAAPVAASKMKVPPAATPAPVALPAKPKPGFSFAYSAPAVGSIESVVDTLNTDMEIEAGKQKVKVINSRVKKFTIKTLAVVDSKVTKLEVAYAVSQETKSVGGKKEDEVGPQSGKIYWVEGDASKITVTSPKGDKVSDEESKAVIKDFDDTFGQVPRMARIVASKSWTVKEKVVMTPADFAILNEKGDAPIGKEGTITLISKNAKTAVFVIEIVASLKNDKVDLQLPTMRMDAIVDVKTLRPTELKMSSKMTGTAQGMPVTGNIKGVKKSTLKAK